jgi:hypothetical protein
VRGDVENLDRGHNSVEDKQGMKVRGDVENLDRGHDSVINRE